MKPPRANGPAAGPNVPRYREQQQQQHAGQYGHLQHSQEAQPREQHQWHGQQQGQHQEQHHDQLQRQPGPGVSDAGNSRHVQLGRDLFWQGVQPEVFVARQGEVRGTAGGDGPSWWQHQQHGQAQPLVLHHPHQQQMQTQQQHLWQQQQLQPQQQEQVQPQQQVHMQQHQQQQQQRRRAVFRLGPSKGAYRNSLMSHSHIEQRPSQPLTPNSTDAPVMGRHGVVGQLPGVASDPHVPGTLPGAAAAQAVVAPEPRLLYPPEDVCIVDTPERAQQLVEKLLQLKNGVRLSDGRVEPVYFACDTEVAGIEVKEESPVGHGTVICFSIYAGPWVNFNLDSDDPGKWQSRVWVDLVPEYRLKIEGMLKVQAEAAAATEAERAAAGGAEGGIAVAAPMLTKGKGVGRQVEEQEGGARLLGDTAAGAEGAAAAEAGSQVAASAGLGVNQAAESAVEALEQFAFEVETAATALHSEATAAALSELAHRATEEPGGVAGEIGEAPLKERAAKRAKKRQARKEEPAGWVGAGEAAGGEGAAVVPALEGTEAESGVFKEAGQQQQPVAAGGEEEVSSAVDSKAGSGSRKRRAGGSAAGSTQTAEAAKPPAKTKKNSEAPACKPGVVALLGEELLREAKVPVLCRGHSGWLALADMRVVISGQQGDSKALSQFAKDLGDKGNDWRKSIWVNLREMEKAGVQQQQQQWAESKVVSEAAKVAAKVAAGEECDPGRVMPLKEWLEGYGVEYQRALVGLLEGEEQQQKQQLLVGVLMGLMGRGEASGQVSKSSSSTEVILRDGDADVEGLFSNGRSGSAGAEESANRSAENRNGRELYALGGYGSSSNGNGSGNGSSTIESSSTNGVYGSSEVSSSSANGVCSSSGSSSSNGSYNSNGSYEPGVVGLFGEELLRKAKVPVLCRGHSGWLALADMRVVTSGQEGESKSLLQFAKDCGDSYHDWRKSIWVNLEEMWKAGVQQQQQWGESEVVSEAAKVAAGEECDPGRVVRLKRWLGEYGVEYQRGKVGLLKGEEQKQQLLVGVLRGLMGRGDVSSQVAESSSSSSSTEVVLQDSDTGVEGLFSNGRNGSAGDVEIASRSAENGNGRELYASGGYVSSSNGNGNGNGNGSSTNESSSRTDKLVLQGDGPGVEGWFSNGRNSSAGDVESASSSAEVGNGDGRELYASGGYVSSSNGNGNGNGNGSSVNGGSTSNGVCSSSEVSSSSSSNGICSSSENSSSNGSYSSNGGHDRNGGNGSGNGSNGSMTNGSSSTHLAAEDGAFPPPVEPVFVSDHKAALTVGVAQVDTALLSDSPSSSSSSSSGGFFQQLSPLSLRNPALGWSEYPAPKDEDVNMGILEAFRGFFKDEGAKKVWHNYGFDRHVLENMGLECGGFGGDTMHMARLWDASRKYSGGYSLGGLSGEMVRWGKGGIFGGDNNRCSTLLSL